MGRLIVSADTLKLCEAFVAVRRHKARKGAEQAKWPLGFEFLGNGLYGEVWEIPGSALVLKVSGPYGWGVGHGWFEPIPDAWPSFAEHCMLHPHEHLPEIYYLKRVSPRITWAVMERLEEAHHTQDFVDFVDLVEDSIKELRDGPEWMWGVSAMRESLQLSTDIHGGNVMYRKSTDSYVLTDPFSSPEGYQ